VGSILRTADGAGIGRIYLCGITPTPDHPRVTRTALGAEKNLQWSWHANSLDLAHSLLQGGKLLWALESLPGAEPVQAMASEKSRPPVVLIVGNELAGIDPELLSLAVRTFAIPMRGTKHSLNAAVALGIAAYELSRARK
jgi:tRNA G18 (ribose-2'-O)-methylase SpoU